MLTGCKCHQQHTHRLAPSPSIEVKGEFSPSTLIIMVDEKVGKVPLREAIQAYKAEVIYDYNIISGMAIRIPENRDIHEAIEYFQKVKGVVNVQRDRINHLIDPVRYNH